MVARIRTVYSKWRVGADDSVRLDDGRTISDRADRVVGPYKRQQEPITPTAGGCGERAVRCQWQIKHGERVAAVKISSVRRKATKKFWVPQQDHAALRDAIGDRS